MKKKYKFLKTCVLGLILAICSVNSMNSQNLIKQLLKTPSNIKEPLEDEFFEDLLSAKNVRVERIISEGHVSPKNFWYDQTQDEWILILQGSAEIITKDKTGQKKLWKLETGDSMFLKAHHQHRVEKTSSKPKTVWLAIHGTINNE